MKKDSGEESEDEMDDTVAPKVGVTPAVLFEFFGMLDDEEGGGVEPHEGKEDEDGVGEIVELGWWCGDYWTFIIPELPNCWKPD